LVDGSRTESHYDAIYNGYIDLQRMIRKDGFKLIVYPKLKKVLLFDMEKDPEEMNDLAELPEYQEKVDMLFSDLLELQNEMKDHLDISHIRPIKTHD
jgi:arylsulfatase A-like enzyme